MYTIINMFYNRQNWKIKKTGIRATWGIYLQFYNFRNVIGEVFHGILLIVKHISRTFFVVILRNNLLPLVTLLKFYLSDEFMITSLLTGFRFKTNLTMYGVLDLDIVIVRNIFWKVRLKPVSYPFILIFTFS